MSRSFSSLGGKAQTAEAAVKNLHINKADLTCACARESRRIRKEIETGGKENLLTILKLHSFWGFC